MKFFRLAVGIALIMTAAPVTAFGLRTHLFIADEMIADIVPDCRVTIRGAEFYVPADICASIRSYPESFRAGVIGPDGFPDFITGQVTTHPGIKDDWQTGDWVARLNDRAQTGPEMAFAAGYAVHAASDVFAHSYVNEYSGDIFDLKDERNVERRHFVLEKYIDYALPLIPDASGLSAPTAFLSRELIFDVDAARLATKSGAAPHIASMYTVRVAVNGLDKELRGVENFAGDLVTKAVLQHLQVAGELASGEAALQAALIALGVNKERLEAMKSLLDIQETAFNDAVGAVERNKELILSLELGAKAARESIVASRSAINSATDFQARAENDLIKLQADIAATPSTITREVCNTVGGVCNSCGWLCSPVCEPAKLVCRSVEVVNDVYSRLVDSARNLAGEIAAAKKTVTDNVVSIAANTALETAKLQEAAQERALTAGLEVAREAARVPFQLARTQYELELAATNQADDNVRRLREQIAKIRERLIDTAAIEQAMKDLFDRVRPLSLYTSNWLKGIDRAGEGYIFAAQESSIAMVNGGGGVLSPYTKWLACHGSAFAGVPYQIPDALCQGEAFITHVDSEIQKIIERVLPEPFASLYRQVADIKAKVRGELKKATTEAALTLAKIVAPDAATAEFIDLLAKPENATRGKLIEVFATRQDSAGKDLLVFTDVAALIDKDIHLNAGRLEPTGFKALAYARILSRLALLDRDGIRNVTTRFGGDARKVVMSDTASRYSVIIDMARSIDGNHQWQPFGLPYPRDASDSQPQAADRRFGYGPGGGPPGFPLFISPELRRDVFSHLFPEAFIGEIGEHRALQWPAYRFPTCGSNPFPVAFQPSGLPADYDDWCKPGQSARTPKPSTWATIKRRWHGFWERFLGVRARPSWSGSAFMRRPSKK